MSKSDNPSRLEPAVDDTDKLLYVGYRNGVEERLVPAEGIPLVALDLATPEHWSILPKALFKLLKATIRTTRVFRNFRPDVLFSTGGFVSLPATLSASIMRTPVVIFLPDVRAGKAIRFTRLFAQVVALSSAESLRYLHRGHGYVVTGYPIRREFAEYGRERARQEMGLSPETLQLLVMGGSLGAQSINRSVARGLNRLLPEAIVLHVCGPSHVKEMEGERSRLPVHLRSRYQLRSYLEEGDMAKAMFASDVAITRAGASILGELPATQLPALVCPLPSKTVGQRMNAEALAIHGGCVVIDDADVQSGKVIESAIALLKDGDRRKKISLALASLACPSAAASIAELIRSQANVV